MNVKGIGEKSFLKLKPLLTVTEKAVRSGVSDRGSMIVAQEPAEPRPGSGRGWSHPVERAGPAQSTDRPGLDDSVPDGNVPGTR